MAGKDGFRTREVVAPPLVEFGALMQDAGRLVGLLCAAVCGQNVIGQVGEVEVGLIRQGVQHQKAFEHLHAQFVDDVQSK
ncbi:hypothetical protein M879_09530 [Mycobacteroides abscessus V06705]|nr:hypothetical protein M879_09530 [Mycobacteroides abscessus V06705]